VKLEQFILVDATFDPKKRSDLKPGVERWIGHRGLWEVVWPLDDDDTYPGQFALSPYERGTTAEATPLHPAIWAPSEDFKVHGRVERRYLTAPPSGSVHADTPSENEKLERAVETLGEKSLRQFRREGHDKL
jgi:hypothetical protein